MNKVKLFFLTTLVCVSPMMNVIASSTAETMYKDFVEYAVSHYYGLTPADKELDIIELQDKLLRYKRALRDEIVERQASRSNDISNTASVVQAIVSAGLGSWFTAAGLNSFSAMSYYAEQLKQCDKQEALQYASYYFWHRGRGIIGIGVGTLAFGAAVCSLLYNYVQLQRCRKNITDVSIVLVKLDELRELLEQEQQKQQAAVYTQ